MDSNTLYYFFSTVAQVLAAICALVAVLSHFKINEIKTFLVGDGKAVYERMNNREQGHQLKDIHEHLKYLARLRDSVGRNSISGIKEVIELLASLEVEPKKRGLKYLEERFNYRINQLNDIKLLTKKSIIFAFLVIAISLISLVFVEQIKTMEYISSTIISIVIILTFMSIIYTIQGVYRGLENQDDE